MAEKAVSEMSDEEIIVHIRALREARLKRADEARLEKENKPKGRQPKKKDGDVEIDRTIDSAFDDVLKGLLE